MQLIKCFFFLIMFCGTASHINAQQLKAGGNSPAKNSGSFCSYFPVIDGMKITYSRKDIRGEYSVVESYTAVKEKTLKSGKVIKGYRINTTIPNRNNSLIYYYCEDGSAKMYSEIIGFKTIIKEYVEDYSIRPSEYNLPDYKKTPIWETEKNGTGKYLSATELKAGRIGTTWTDRTAVNGQLVTISSKIIEMGLTLTVRGKTYSPVIHVQRTVVIDDDGDDFELNTQEIYYARGVGKVKVIEKGNDPLGGKFTTTQELVSHNLPAYNDVEDDKQTTGNAANNAVNDKLKLLKGKIDADIVGTWKFTRIGKNAVGEVSSTIIGYIFNADGSYVYYYGSMNPQDIMGTGVWKMNKDSLELISDKDPAEIVTKIVTKKLNNKYSGKPSLVLQWSTPTDMREFESQDNKKPWPGIPAFGDKMEPEKKEVVKLEGNIDKDMVGSWRNEINAGYTVRYTIYKFNADGTGELIQGSTKGRMPTVQFEWRVKDNVIWRSRDCGAPEKCIQHNEGVEKIMLPGNKRALKIGEYKAVYQYMGQ